MGHDVKPFVKRQKNDKNDAAAIYETLSRPDLRFVKVRSVDDQAVLMGHKAREMLVQQRTQLVAVATANKLARMAFALMRQNTRYSAA